MIIKTDSTANIVTIDGDTTESINGNSTDELTSQWDKGQYYSDGANILKF